MNPVGKVVLWFAGFMMLWAFILGTDLARGHDAGGWQYPAYCCHEADCAAVDKQSEGSDGKAVGQTRLHKSITLDPARYTHKMTSPDGKMHVCATPDGVGGRRYFCIFNPAGM